MGSCSYCRTHKKKNSQKMALHPFSPKFGTQVVERITQSLAGQPAVEVNLTILRAPGVAVSRRTTIRFNKGGSP